jgi:predicted regulator of Ras-like GTPase activity (Roadblock/LC7/MglB family)
MTPDLANAVAKLVQAVGDGQGALLMALDGVPVEQAPPAPGADLEAIAGEYGGLLRQALALAAELNCGVPQRFSVRGTNRRVVFAFVPGDLAVGVEGGPASLCSQIRHAVAQAAGRLGEF